MKKAKWKIKFYKNKFSLILFFHRNKLQWKDKFGSPRCEYAPSFRFEWFGFGIYGTLGDDNYWEQWLWIYEYHFGDIGQAKATWGWIDMDTNKSTWKDY
jgi:hypothetical protein